MKAKELKLMSKLDIEGKLIELKKEMMKLNSQIATGTVPKNPGKVMEIKRTIAKILTINNEQMTNNFNNKKEGSKKE